MRFHLSHRGAAAWVLVLLSLASLGVPARGYAQPLPSAEEVVARATRAMGEGHASEHHFRRTISSMDLGGMTVTTEILQARPNLVVTRAEMGGMAMSTGFDGEVAWALDAFQGARILDGEEREALLTMHAFEPAATFATDAEELETVGRASVGDRPCYEVRARTGDGEVFACFDVESGLLLSVRVPAAADGTPETLMLFEDYQPTDGVLIARRMVTLAGPVEAVVAIESVSHEPLDLAVFALPDEVRALLQ